MNKLSGLSVALGQIFVLGFVSTLVQIIMMREFMFVFGGNELIIGVILANWMVLTGIGAFAGKSAVHIQGRETFSRNAMVVLGWIPPVLFFFIEFLRNFFFKTGAEIGFYQILVSTVIFLAPFCFLSGFLFTCLADFISHQKIRIPAEKSYAIESTGSLLAGVSASFILFSFMSNFQALLLLPVCTGIFLLVPSGEKRSLIPRLIILISIGISVSALFILKADHRLKEVYFLRQEVLFFRDTPYGNLSVTKTADQLNIFDNGKLLFSTDNQMANEEAVHFAMAQHPDPRNVLLVSGGISGITGEILKYKVERVDYVEINPLIFTLGQKYTSSLEDSRIHLIKQDARMFLKKTGPPYDVVLINLPEPSTAQLNRFYTVEFLYQVREHMNNGGIIALNMPSTVNYLSDEALLLNSVIYNTCKEVFTEVLIIPGQRNYYLASDKPLTLNIAQLIENKNIKNYYVNLNYIDTLSLQERSDYLMKHLNLNAVTNKDFKPVSYFYYLGYWLSQFNLGKNFLWAMLILFTLALAAAGILFKPVTSSLMITGFSASSLEIILLLALQILSGYIYQVIGICIAVFMGGLALGARVRSLLFPRITYMQFTVVQLNLSAVALFIPTLLVINKVQSSITLATCVVLVLLFIIAFGTGILFSLSLHLRTGNMTENIAVLYSADLIGSALGAFLTSIFLVPLLGIMNSSRLMGGLLLLFALNLFLRRKTFPHPDP
jgi:spermidine synthase